MRSISQGLGVMMSLVLDSRVRPSDLITTNATQTMLRRPTSYTNAHHGEPKVCAQNTTDELPADVLPVSSQDPQLTHGRPRPP